MNCKPGQMAVVTRTCGFPQAAPYIGIVLRVLTVGGNTRFGPFWQVERGPLHPRGTPSEGHWISAVADCLLTPLDGGDLSDSALDKIIKEIEHA